MRESVWKIEVVLGEQLFVLTRVVGWDLAALKEVFSFSGSLARTLAFSLSPSLPPSLSLSPPSLSASLSIIHSAYINGVCLCFLSLSTLSSWNSSFRLADITGNISNSIQHICDSWNGKQFLVTPTLILPDCFTCVCVHWLVFNW